MSTATYSIPRAAPAKQAAATAPAPAVPASPHRGMKAYRRTQQEDMVATYAPLVKRIAHRTASRMPANIEVDDLVQAGMMGLYDAIQRYQETPTAQFETYAVQRIKGAIADELRALDWMPRMVRERSRKVEDAIEAQCQALGRQPTDAEVARAMGLKMDEYCAWLQEGAGAQLLYTEDLGPDADRYIHHGDDSFDELSVRQAADPLATLLAKGLRQSLIEAVNALPERERLLLGLSYEQELSLKEIGLAMEISEARVCQLRTQAIARLRAMLLKKKP